MRFRLKGKSFLSKQRFQLIFAAFGLIWLPIQNASTQNQPNIILINLDDARTELVMVDDHVNAYEFFPNIQSLAEKSVTFTNCHATSPLCGPSRASLLRGQYANQTRILVNTYGASNARRFTGGMQQFQLRGYMADNLPTWTKSLGYQNYFVGKYLHANQVNVVPDGWDEFRASRGGKYFGTSRFINGKPERLADDQYRTDMEGAEVLELLEKHSLSSLQERPFFLYWAPFCPHAAQAGEEMVSPQYRELWKDVGLFKTAAFAEEDMSDKPLHYQMVSQIEERHEEQIAEFYRDQLRAMKSFDVQLGEMLNKLSNLGLRENTYIMLTSDNGYMHGDHRISAKTLPFNPATMIPMIVAGPGITERHRANHLLAHIDIAPTIVDLAGGTVPDFCNGKSFRALLSDSSAPAPDWRDAILIENYQVKSTRGVEIPATYNAIRTYDEFFVEWSNGQKEYYDLVADRHQLENQYNLLDAESRVELQSLLKLTVPKFERPIVTNCEPRNRNQPAVTVLGGVAEHDSEIESVQIIVQDTETLLCWDGSQWTNGRPRIECELLNPGGTITEWRYRFSGAPSNTSKRYRFWTRAYSKKSFGVPATETVVVDAGLPQNDVTSPTPDAILPLSFEIKGTATDNVKIRRVVLVLRDLDTKEYWNGREWNVARSHFIAKLESPNHQESNWSANVVSTQPRRIRLFGKASDFNGNLQNPATQIDFTIE